MVAPLPEVVKADRSVKIKTYYLEVEAKETERGES